MSSGTTSPAAGGAVSTPAASSDDEDDTIAPFDDSEMLGDVQTAASLGACESVEGFGALWRAARVKLAAARAVKAADTSPGGSPGLGSEPNTPFHGGRSPMARPPNAGAAKSGRQRSVSFSQNSANGHGFADAVRAHRTRRASSGSSSSKSHEAADASGEAADGDALDDVAPFDDGDWETVPLGLDEPEAVAAGSAGAVAGADVSLGDGFLAQVLAKRKSMTLLDSSQYNRSSGRSFRKPPERIETFFKARRRTSFSSASRRSSAANSRRSSFASLMDSDNDVGTPEPVDGTLRGGAAEDDLDTVIFNARVNGVALAESMGRASIEAAAEGESDHLQSWIADVAIPEARAWFDLLAEIRADGSFAAHRSAHQLLHHDEPDARSSLEAAEDAERSFALLTHSESVARSEVVQDASEEAACIERAALVSSEELERVANAAAFATQREALASQATFERSALDIVEAEAGRRRAISDVEAVLRFDFNEAAARDRLVRAAVEASLPLVELQASLDDEFHRGHLEDVEAADRLELLAACDAARQHLLSAAELQAAAERVASVTEPTARSEVEQSEASARQLLEKRAAEGKAAAVVAEITAALRVTEADEAAARDTLIAAATSDVATAEIKSPIAEANRLARKLPRLASVKEPERRRAVEAAEAAAWQSIGASLALQGEQRSAFEALVAHEGAEWQALCDAEAVAVELSRMSPEARAAVAAAVAQLERTETSQRRHAENEEAAERDALELRLGKKIRKLQRHQAQRDAQASAKEQSPASPCVGPGDGGSPRAMLHPSPPAVRGEGRSPRRDGPASSLRIEVAPSAAEDLLSPIAPSSPRPTVQSPKALGRGAREPSSLRSKWDRVLRELAEVDEAFAMSSETPAPEELNDLLARSRRRSTRRGTTVGRAASIRKSLAEGMPGAPSSSANNALATQSSHDALGTSHNHQQGSSPPRTRPSHRGSVMIPTPPRETHTAPRAPAGGQPKRPKFTTLDATVEFAKPSDDLRMYGEQPSTAKRKSLAGGLGTSRRVSTTAGRR